MKKFLIFLIISALMISGFALADLFEGVEPIVGRITEVREDGSYLVSGLTGEQQYHVIVDENTNVIAEWTLTVGDVVTIAYDGVTSRSMPPQLTAMSIQSSVIVGEVDELDRNNPGRMLVESKDMGDVWVTLPEGLIARDFDDRDVRVYTTGMIAMSYPAQATALAVEIIHSEDGRVNEIGDGYLMIHDDGLDIRVTTDAHTKMADIRLRDEVVVYYAGEKLHHPTELHAIAVVIDLDD